MSINRVIISGNLTRDPDFKLTQGGTPVLSLGVAVNDRRRNPQTGEWEDVPNFVDCVMFGSRAQSVSRFLSKGLKVAIEGKLRYSSWERDGQKRSKLEVVIDEIEFMSARNSQSQTRQDQEVYASIPQQTRQDPYYANQVAPSVVPPATMPTMATPPAVSAPVATPPVAPAPVATAPVPTAQAPSVSAAVPTSVETGAYQQVQPVQDQGFAQQNPSATPPSTDVYDEDIPF